MTEIEIHTPWNSNDTLLLIGPGGVGKSSLGLELGALLGWQLIDLDMEFKCRFGDISSYIRNEGYGHYKLTNSQLAGDLYDDIVSPTILVTSSGFLTPDNPKRALTSNLNLLAESYSICLLPSRDLEVTVGVVIERQMSRTFSTDRTCEEATIRQRYSIYANLGDLIIFSSEAPQDIAKALALHITGET